MPSDHPTFSRVVQADERARHPTTMHSSNSSQHSPSRKRPNSSREDLGRMRDEQCSDDVADGSATSGQGLTLKRRRNASPVRPVAHQSNSHSNSNSTPHMEPDPIESQPQLHTPHVAVTWHDTLRKVLRDFQSTHPTKNSFTHDEILSKVEHDFTRFRPNEKRSTKQGRWKNNLSKAIRTNPGILVQDPAHPGSFVIRDINFTAARRRRSDPAASTNTQKFPEGQKSTNPAESSTSAQNRTVSVIDDEGPRVEEHTLRATIPPEWVAEPSGPVRLSSFDRSQMLINLPTENAVRGNKGFRSVRATVGVSEGDWYYEAEILQYAGNGAVRPGWTTRRSDIETPAGFDVYGFSLRDKTGEFVHCARRSPYGKPFSCGDVVGCRIMLPELSPKERETVTKADHAWLQFRFVNLLQGQPPPDSGIDITQRAKVMFYLNGKCLGVPSMFEKKAGLNDSDQGKSQTATPSDEAMGNDENPVTNSRVDGTHLDSLEGPEPNLSHDSKNTKQNKVLAPIDAARTMRAGLYYPSLSLFGDSRVKANFGPTLQHLPKGSRAMCEAIGVQSKRGPIADSSSSSESEEDVQDRGDINRPSDLQTGRQSNPQSVETSASKSMHLGTMPYDIDSIAAAATAAATTEAGAIPESNHGETG